MADDAPETDDHDQTVYDRYVDLVLAGDAPPPEEFLAGNDDAGDVLRERLAAVWAAAHAGTATPVPDTPPFERLGAFRVLRRLGEGGMGAVYLGEQEELGRLAALKVLRPELQGSATIAARFEREAQVIARLRHPNIVTIYGVGEQDGTRFLALEFIEGQGLDEVIAQARDDGHALPVETCVRWAVQIAGALQAAHEAGVVHRDVKPSNVRITSTGDAMLLDFGIAAEEGTAQLTRTGHILGTTGYAAPEQVRAETPDARTDVYALGLVLYEALTGVQPFEGGGEAQVIQRVLSDDVPPARRLRATIPRDLETVLQVAIEKAPSRRYDSTAALAADLASVLAVRPIAARRAGPLRVIWKWARRHPLAAGLATALIVGGLAAFSVSAWQRRAEAREALESARVSVTAFRAAAAKAQEAEHQFAWLEQIVESEYMSAEQDARHAAAERVIRESRRTREAIFHQALEHLRRAEQLMPGVAEADEVRADLFLARWREALDANDTETAAFYRRQVLRYDPDGKPAELIAGTGVVRVACETPGAVARVFRFVLQSTLVESGEPRFVPVPLGEPPPVAPGTWALRLLADHPPLYEGDLVTAVAGERLDEASWRQQAATLAAGARVTAHGRSTRGAVDLPSGARVRITTQPLVWTEGPDALADDGVEVAAGPVLVVVRAPGHAEARLAANVAAGEVVVLRARLLPTEAIPSGFVRIVPSSKKAVEPFWIRETETTAAEYLAFLNDQGTLDEIAASTTPTRYPRSVATRADGGHWPREADGRYRIRDDWPDDWPVLGVSFDDAVAYCRWWTERARERGEPWVASLPTLAQWVQAGQATSSRLYVFGDRFHPKWVNSCFSQPQARPEAVLSYPRDESLLGVFDMSGSLFEWLDEPWSDDAGRRHAAGGSWGRAERELFRVWGGQGHATTAAGDELGFRIVLTRRAPDPSTPDPSVEEQR